MILAAHQLHYLPWLGYLDKIDQSDVFVILDDVQFEKNGWQNRNRIRTPKGLQWLTIPVLHKFGQPLNETRIDSHQNWRQTHLKALTLNYRRSAFFKSYQGFVEEAYQRSWDYLAEINLHWLRFLVDAFGIQSPRPVRSSEVPLKGLKGTERLVAFCKFFKADTYLSGQGAKAYLDRGLFEKEGIRLIFQEFSPPRYEHLGTPSETTETVSSIDLLFNQGPRSPELLRKGRLSWVQK